MIVTYPVPLKPQFTVLSKVTVHFIQLKLLKLLGNICAFKILVSLLKPERFCAFIIKKKHAVEHKTGKFQGTCNDSRTTYNSFCKCGMEGKFHPYHYFQIIFTKHMCDQSHESQTAGRGR
jgi:hypothetical protein